MKKLISFLLAFVCVLGLLGCSNQSSAPVNTFQSEWKTYPEMRDGTWLCDGHTYKYRLEIKGTMPNASAETTFVYLSNFETITFDQAWKAAGLSSNTDDYFAVKDAVLVDSFTG